MEGFLETSNGRLSYRHIEGKTNLNVVFMHGTLSDKNASKSLFLEQTCREIGVSFTVFDFLGHGESYGVYTDGTIGKWLQNALDIIDRVTHGKLILVGSSMGGWIMLLSALACPERISGLIGMAAAPDFTVDLWNSFSETQKNDIKTKGVIYTPNGWTEEGDPWTFELFNDAEKYLLLDKKTLDIVSPVTLIHGGKDDCVPVKTSFRIMNAVKSDNVKVIVLKNSGHRLSEATDLDILRSVLELHVKAAEDDVA